MGSGGGGVGGGVGGGGGGDSANRRRPLLGSTVGPFASRSTIQIHVEIQSEGSFHTIKTPIHILWHKQR